VSAHAQVTLENFSSFQSATTLFYGDWSSTGDPFSGSTTPIASFTQGLGVYNLVDATNADSAFVERTFGSLVNIGTNNLLSLSLKLLAGNTADTFTVTLTDNSGNSAVSATFLTSSFTTAGFTTVSVAFGGDFLFDPTAVSSFRISGTDPLGGGTFSLALNDLSATGARPLTAVPEPSTYGALGAAALLALVALRRRRA
jgi:hypothetical protein